MKLFDNFEAIRFRQENLIFITHNGYLYYIFYPEKHHPWERYKRAGYDRLTVENYDEINREELTEAMGGRFPKKETDFLRVCNPNTL